MLGNQERSKAVARQLVGFGGRGKDEDQGQEPEVDSATLRAAEPTSLGLLAAGHVAVADWRRRLTEDHQAYTPLT